MCCYVFMCFSNRLASLPARPDSLNRATEDQTPIVISDIGIEPEDKLHIEN
jgi:hypothetical protein